MKRENVRYRLVTVVCVVSLLAAFVVDLLTPQLFVAAILLDVPIVLSSLGGSRNFRLALIVAALIADVVAGYVNGLESRHWDPIGIGDRILAGLSIVFVGYLSTAVSESAQREALAASQEARARREAQIAAAIDRVRASFSTELVLRSIAYEALALMEATSARFVVTGQARMTLVAQPGNDEVQYDETRLPPEVASLVQRTLDDGDVLTVLPSDAIGRLLLDTFQAPAMLALPIADRERRFGAVLVALRSPDHLDDVRAVAQAFARQATGALAQARVFEQLAERNELLEERSAVIRDLVYALSHDLRTPLAALGMTLRQAQAGAYGELPETYGDIVARSIIATDDLQRLADTLLLVARFESGDRAPERESVDLDDLARQISGELEALAAARHVHLNVSLAGGTFTAGDRGDLRRAITNLVANALEHTPEEGRVQIAVGTEGETAFVRVDDDGFGIAEPARARLFTRFARGDSRRGGGSGLGLYIVRRVAEESGGSITYEPREPHGSIFTLRIPVLRTA